MSAYDALVAADRALFHWPLDDTGSTAADIIAHANDGTLLHSPTTGVAGPVSGQAAMGFPNVYPAASPYVLLAHAALIPRPPAAFSLEAWIQNTDPFNPAYYWVLSTGTPGAFDFSAQIQFLINSADAADLWYYSNASGETANATPLFDGAWHHIVFTFDGVGTSVWYLDGTALALVRDDGFSGPRPIAAATPTDAVLAGNAANVGIGGDVGVGNLAGNLAHVAVYDYALSPCRVLSHYDQATTGSHTPCPDWVRVSHSSGQGYWQSRGDVSEEWAGGARRLLLPLPELTTTPPILVGQDPATNLPAYCPQATAVTQIVPIPPVIPPPMGADPHEALCGAATAMADWLEAVYQNLANWVGGLESTLLAVVLDVVINVVIDALTAGAGVALGFLDQGAIVTLSTFITTHLVGSDWPSLSSSADDTIRNTAYCALQPTVGNIIVTDAIVADWSSRLNAANVGTIFPSGVTVPVLRLVMLCVGPAKFQQLAVAGSASPTSACSGVTCP